MDLSEISVTFLNTRADDFSCIMGCGGSHSAYYKGSIPCYVCEMCSAVYLLEMLCLDKDEPTHWGLYLKINCVDDGKNVTVIGASYK